MAYAAVISLMHTIQRLKFPINRKITKSAYEKLDSLSSSLKRLDARNHRNANRSVINELDAKIRDAVWKVEDVLESSLIPPSQGLHQKGVEKELDSCLKTVMELRKEYNRELDNPSPEEEDDAALVSPPVHNSTTVGSSTSDLSEMIRNKLLRGSSNVPALVGMAGIGKTHIASEIFQHPLILEHFDSRVWVRVGPKDQSLSSIVAGIVSQLTEHEPRNLFHGVREDRKINVFKQILRGRRYLIVLDDVWSDDVLRYIQARIPDNGTGNQFLVTTRLQEVAKYVGRNKTYEVPFLNNEESWILLRQSVFAENSFISSALEKVGRKIAEHCEGLPLLILAVSNILRGLDKTEEYWNKVAEKKTTTFTDAYDQIYKVLLSSYEYLPQHLRPCFLYMGVFPQSCAIPLSKLINLCGAEDFLEPSKHQKLLDVPKILTFEEFAMECMEDLVSRNLAIICKQRSLDELRRIKYSKLHSAYWYLCVKVAGKNNFFHVLNKLTDVSIEKPRRLSVQNNVLFGIKEACDSIAADTSSTTTRSLLFTGEDHQYPVGICFDMMVLMKVLDAVAIRFYEFPEEVLNLLQLRYLSLTHNGELPSSISTLQHLQWLILRRHHNIKLLRDSICLPKEIWDMKELRHLRIMGSNLPDPSKDSKLPNLLTLHVSADSCTQDVFKSIPRLKKLGIKIELHPDAAAETIRCLEHIMLLKRLESLKCVVVNPRLRSQVAVAPPEHLSNLPRSLKKLSLSGLGYPWKYLSVIASLPELQVLKLRCSAFQGLEWETMAGQFSKLKFLLLEDIDLVHWINDRCFEGLRHLIIRHCFKLKMIPRYLSEYTNMEKMEADDCSPSFVASLQKTGRYDFKYQVVINSSWKLLRLDEKR